MPRTDEQIKKHIFDELYWDNRVDASKITVKVDKGIVTLEGEVPTYREAMAASTAVWRIEGVLDVIDNIRVLYTTPPELPGDDEIEMRINNIITWDSAIYEAHVKTVVNEGVVTLEGTVDAHWKKYYIENKVNTIRGVLGIENLLAVVPTKAIGDEKVAKDIMDALARDALIDIDVVTAEVENGVVALSGTVPSMAASQSAWEDASRTEGVVRIVNNLRVAD